MPIYTKSINLDAVNETTYIQNIVGAQIVPNGNMSVVAWLKRASSGTGAAISWARDMGTGIDGIYFGTTGAGGAFSQGYVNNSSCVAVSIATGCPAVDAWGLYALCRNGDAWTYYAGTASGNAGTKSIDFSLWDDLRVGDGTWGGAGKWSGNVGRMAIFGTDISANLASWRSTPNAVWSGAIHEWIFGNDPTDSSDSTDAAARIHDQIGDSTWDFLCSATDAGDFVVDYPT